MNRTIVYTLICTVLFLAITAGIRHAGNLGYIEEDMVRRSVQVMIGLGLAIWSNFTPKQLGPVGSPQTEALKQRLLRVTGWSMVLAGLTYAGLWAFAPLDFAKGASVAVVLAALAVTLGYAARTVAACRTISASGGG